MINKKAQTEIGKTLTFFPVFLIVTFLMVVFILITINFSLLKKQTSPEIISPEIPENNLLLKKIEISLDNHPQKKVLVIDALAEYIQGRINRNSLDSAIKPLLNEKNNCYILYSESKNIGETSEKGYIKTASNLEEIRGNLRDYFPEWEKLQIKTISLSAGNAQDRITYYYGKC
ncbi:MAG: hypothetical protein AABX73_01920 [Nanoarchaeota archaeon]